jgi:hypothetical protein
LHQIKDFYIAEFQKIYIYYPILQTKVKRILSIFMLLTLLFLPVVSAMPVASAATCDTTITSFTVSGNAAKVGFHAVIKGAVDKVTFTVYSGTTKVLTTSAYCPHCRLDGICNCSGVLKPGTYTVTATAITGTCKTSVTKTLVVTTTRVYLK